jgi:uncharacterized protein YkwD
MLVVERHKLLLQLVVEKQQQLLQPLRHLRLQLLQLVRLRRVTIPEMYKGGDMAKTILAVQNQERAEVGVPPLTWSDKLAAGAQTWADHMATTGEFGHSTCCGAFRDYGENLAVVKGDNAMGGIVGAGQKFWISEKKDYHGGPFQTIASNGAPGHYAQMVWRTTTEVGCATASGNGGTTAVLVCRYTPPGNTVGQSAY